MDKRLYEIHISFLEPAEAIINATGSSEEEVVFNLRATLDQVKELKILSVKDLGPSPEEASTEAPAPVKPNQIN
ncbi:hypothetical protein [Bradyrhizobium erythrophlei]|uniref:Uncharacterized protein n=1 Tax=Bradyrhizobium erythrophlei TaxID=1437360 RepID=A0A1M5TB67_9BRAD|nr:hypothetical protein [Bradyrhizobium erythrophlei]SHH47850.1 hypothetical protein SAMN05444169_7651 [Bradyrhizobium erythrophlei]